MVVVAVTLGRKYSEQNDEAAPAKTLAGTKVSKIGFRFLEAGLRILRRNQEFVGVAFYKIG